MKVLIISPHTDDGELGCGATIARLVREGHEVISMCFSYCGNTELSRENTKSFGILGIKDLYQRDFPVRGFDKERQTILECMYNHKEKYDLIFCPASDDIHQDHRVVTEEAKRAFKHTRLLGYELPWNSQGFKGNCFYKINKADLEIKKKALFQYKSQEHRTYFGRGFIESLARVRGVQAGCDYAECFEVIRWYE